MNNLSKIVFLLLFSTTVFAQGVCDITTGVEKGSFTFDGPSTVCIGQAVKLRDNSGGTGVRYIFGYTGQPASQLSSISSQTNLDYTFLAAGQYTVLQYGKKNGRDMYYCDVVRVLANTEPVFTTSACNDDFLQIIIGNDPANNFDYYQIDWGDATPVENIPAGTTLPIIKTRKYSSYLSTRLIRVEGFYNTPSSCPRATAKQVKMDGGNDYPNIKTIELSEDGTSAKITLTGALDNYSLYQRSASGNYVNGQAFMVVKPGTFTVNLVDPVQSCFKVYRSYGCNEGSGEVCTTKLDAKAQNKDNVLSWMSHASGGITQIYGVQTIVTGVTTTVKKEEVGGTSTVISSLGNPHIDQVDCSKVYCYQVVNKIQGTIDYGRHTYESFSLSPKVCINRTDVSPDAITESVVTVKDNNQVEINIIDNSPWTLQRKEYIYYKFENNNLDKIHSGSLNKQYIDASTDASIKSYCYKVAFIDECGSTSAASPALCTIFLDNVSGGNLEWTNLSPFGTNISQFEIQSFNEQTNIPTPEATKKASEIVYKPNLDNFEIEAKYRIKATSANGTESFSNTYTIPIAVKLFLPDAFTPNGDNMNDILTIKGSTRRVINFEFQIYNRWGTPVFSSIDPSTSWDGTFQSNKVPSDTYSYKIIAQLDDGKELIKSGRFLLLR
ncbi:gliding motility-associated C-terminal domain-containing protein [Emticicia sp. W12TSBA100-4]|uniref:gliding motility-associated C-terminal domain-containing protein n=1 Tax=Emticicia sp. W12TSBA100-4 TaxID=3160965 RepID=UPI0033059000